MGPDDQDAAERAVREAIWALAHGVNAIERRVLDAVKNGTREAASWEDAAGELVLLGKAVCRVHREVEDLRDRRDLGFETQMRLRVIAQHCLWLYRKTHLERWFFKKWGLETRLRAVLPSDALRLYQELSDADAAEREFSGRSDEELKRAIQEEEGVTCGAAPTEPCSSRGPS